MRIVDSGPGCSERLSARCTNCGTTFIFHESEATHGSHDGRQFLKIQCRVCSTFVFCVEEKPQ